MSAPTAKRVKKIITKYEVSFNEIAELTKEMRDGYDPGHQYIADDIQREAHTLFLRLHDLHDHLASRPPDYVGVDGFGQRMTMPANVEGSRIVKVKR